MENKVLSILVIILSINVILSINSCKAKIQNNSEPWKYNNNRLAVSFDGNSEPDNAYKWPTGDPDDWGAAAASLAIVAKLGLQDKTSALFLQQLYRCPCRSG